MVQSTLENSCWGRHWDGQRRAPEATSRICRKQRWDRVATDSVTKLDLLWLLDAHYKVAYRGKQ